MANITEKQLIEYDTKIKQYIQTQISQQTANYKQTINKLNVTITSLQNEIETLQDKISYLENSCISTSDTMCVDTLNDNSLVANSRIMKDGISLMSIASDEIVVNEDIQEDYIIYDRVISPNEDKEYKNIVVTTDNKSNRIFFSMWYTFDDRELKDKEISIIWINAVGDKGESLCVDKQLIGNRLYFAWNVPGTATVKAGSIQYAIRITEGSDYAWHTLPAIIECVQGLMDDGWDDLNNATTTPGWVDYIEGKYGAGLQIISESEYDSLTTKSDDILYIVKMSDNTINQYLGETPITSNSSSNSGESKIVQLSVADYEALGDNIEPDTLYLLTE